MSQQAPISRIRSFLYGSLALAWAAAGAYAAVAIVEDHLAARSAPVLPWETPPPGWRVLEWMWAFWIFLFGACIGSFLNVVIYRLPARVSIVSKPSHCPVCSTPIKIRDNVPIWGWLMLRGRCRQCRSAISPRYPRVEFAVAAVFQWLYLWEVAWVGVAKTELDSRAKEVGVVALFLAGNWLPLGRFSVHCFLVAMLVVLTMMAWDRQRPTKRLIAFAMNLLLAVGVIWPQHFYAAPLDWRVPSGADAGPMIMRLQPLFGAIAGVLLGTAVRKWFLRHGAAALPEADASFGATVIIGIALGWQLVVVTTAAAIVASCVLSYIACRWLGGRPVPYPASALAGTLIALACV